MRLRHHRHIALMAPILTYLTTQLALSAPTVNQQDARLGAVASESSICSQIGVDTLQAGGNAADALVATTLCVGVVGMYHSGIGGGGFMIVRGSNGSYENIDFRETAPAAAFEDMYKQDAMKSIYTGLASGVPGELRGLQYLHHRYGALEWKDCVMPAVKVARFGWNVTADLVRYMASATSVMGDGTAGDFLKDDPTWAVDFAPKGKRLVLGEKITRKRYADTLEVIANEGADAFYTGAIAAATIATLTRYNGTMTLDDLKNYTVALRKPATIEYRGYKLTSCSAPASGVVALAVMNIIKGYEDIGDAKTLNLSTHRLDEAMRFAYGMRAELGDPSYVKGLQTFEDEMVSEETAKLVRSKINDSHTFNVSYYDPKGLESLETPGTSHIVAADKSGMAISLTTTVNLLFGSHVMVPETGVIMNNEMNDFSIPNTTNAFGYIPSPANYIRPSKRPLSSISPTIVEHLSNETLYYITGAAGGSRITTSTIQSLWHVLDHNMTSLAALSQPRLHDQLVPDVVELEYSFDNGTAAALRERGHVVKFVALGASAVQAVRVLGNGTFEAAGEPRQLNSAGFAV